MSDPRATQVYNNSNDQEEVAQVISQLQSSQNVNAFFVLSKFIDCPEVKEQPEFSQILFDAHLQVVLQLIEWMLLPKQVVKRKKIKTNVDSYPYQCREFMKNNWCFYEQMYLAARSKKFQFGIWFNFLRKEHFDKQTIYTALGYFSDVMIPFAKYQFSGSFNLSQSVQVSQANRQIQTLSIMKILPQALIDQLIKYCHYDPIYQFLQTSILVSIEDPRDYEVSRSALTKLLRATQIPGLFAKFPVLTPQASDDLAKNIDFLQNIANSFKQMMQNIVMTAQPFTIRSIAFISTIVQTNIIKYVVDQLMKSRLCGMLGKQKQKDRLHSSVSATSESTNQMAAHILSLSSSNQSLATQFLLPAQGCFPIITDADQEDIAQTLFKIISSLVQIFVRMPKNLNNHEEEQQYEERDQKREISMAQILNDVQNKFIPKNQSKAEQKSENTLTVPSSPTTLAYLKSKQKIKQYTHEEYFVITTEFRKSMQYILDNLQTLNKFVYNQTESGTGSSYAKVIPFSNGENVKAISMMKVQYFRLVHNCLIMIQLKDPDLHGDGDQASSPLGGRRTSIKKLKSLNSLPFDLKFQKLHLIQIIKKYLIDNSWNNIAHHLLQKICHLLIICSYDYVKKNLEKDKYKKFSDNFLSFLIENFTKKNFIFLSSVRFTSFGNLHSLYNIAKDLAYTLNNTNELVIFLNQFEPWKNFIMTQLKEYEESTFPKATKPEFNGDSEKEENDGVNKLKVDEADSIKKLIQNISVTKKWPNKVRNKNLSKSQVFPYRNSGDSYKKQEAKDHMLKTNEPSSHSKAKQSGEGNRKQATHELALDQILKRKMQYSKKGSQVRQFDLEEISVQKQQQKKKGTSRSEIMEPSSEHGGDKLEIPEVMRNNSDPSIKQSQKDHNQVKQLQDKRVQS